MQTGDGGGCGWPMADLGAQHEEVKQAEPEAEAEFNQPFSDEESSQPSQALPAEPIQGSPETAWAAIMREPYPPGAQEEPGERLPCCGLAAPPSGTARLLQINRAVVECILHTMYNTHQHVSGLHSGCL